MIDQNKNPYTGLLDVMRNESKSQQPLVSIVGEVISAEPLKVKAMGIELDADDLLINAEMTKGYKRDLKLKGSFCEVSTVNDAVSETRTQILAYGDKVLLIPDEQRQQYAIICKLVGVN